MRIRLGTLVVVVAAVAAAVAGPPAGAEPHAAPAKIDPRLRPVLAAARADSVLARRLGATVDGVPVLLELAAPVDEAALAALRACGVTLAEPDGRPVYWGRFVGARVHDGALAALEALPAVRRVRWSAPAHERPMLDFTTALIGLEGARGARPDLDLLTGHGILFGSKDTNIDVFHPGFFFADAGYHDWIDVDADGFLSPGVDAIDLDGDGAAAPGETARLLRAEPTDTLGYTLPARDPDFDPSVDWLWLDEDGDGARGHGPAAGFDDTAPAFGEPLFVPDDFDRDGLLGVGERVARLGGSKIRALYVNVGDWTVDPPAATEHVFVRGVDLTENVLEYSGGIGYGGYSDASHASAVTSILLGDVPLAGRRRVGIAPDAEIVVSYGGFGAQEGFLWLLARNPDVVVYEYGGWLNPLDGSGPVEALIDESTRDGMVHACAAGNWGGDGDHAFVLAGSGESAHLPMLITSGAPYLPWAALVALNIRGGGEAPVRLTEPDGTVHEASGSFDSSPLGNGGDLYTWSETTDRGTRHVNLDLFAADSSESLPLGTWSIDVEPAAAGSMSVDAYIYYGSYYGELWDPAIVSASRTLSSPGLADLCITAGAAAGHPSTPAEPWFYGDELPRTVRDYSARGPRIDGARKPDVVAPDNPWAAAPENVIVDLATRLDDGVRPHGAVDVFGGTSGATPHVGGVAALLVQSGLRGVDVADAIRAAAAPPDGVSVPSDEYGWGFLDAAAALGGAPDGARPTVRLRVLERGATWAVLEPVVADSDSPAAALEAKWDDGYDGAWDVPYAAAAPRRVFSTGSLVRPFKVRVRDDGGRFAEDVAWVQFGPLADPAIATTPAPGCRCAIAGPAAPHGGALFMAMLAMRIALARRHRRRG